MLKGGPLVQFADQIVQSLQGPGFARLAGKATLDLLGPPSPADWLAFAASWDDLGPDLYMADGGRYRRRRHATFRLSGAAAERQPHQPHYQSRDHNRLNGDIERWFEPVTPEIERNPVMAAVFNLCGDVFARAGGRQPRQPWRIEVHQFRIEASAASEGRPTPEGFHRDGVDWVFVMLVGRRNAAEGVTKIGTADGRPLGAFALAQPGDAIWLDDARVLHGVTPIHPLDTAAPAYRDALVVTFLAEPAS
jgi:hypothetical protein